MRRALSLIVLGALPAFAQTPASQMVCVGQAEGPRSEAITVFIHVDPDGRRVASYASWLPPVLASSGSGGLDQPDTQLLIGYNEVGKANLGRRNEAAQVLVFAFSPPRSRIAGATLQKRLASLSGEARFDGGALVRFGFNQPGPAHQDLPGHAMRTAELALPAALPAELELRIAAKGGKPGVTVRYATGAITSRDALFAQAWSQADKAAATPASCEPTMSGETGYAGASPPG